MASIEEICSEHALWARLSARARSIIVAALRDYIAFGDTHASEFRRLLFETPVDDYEARYRAYTEGRGPYPSWRGEDRVIVLLRSLVDKARTTLPLFESVGPCLTRAGYFRVGMTPSEILGALSTVRTYGVPRVEQLLTLPETWARYAAPIVIDSVTRGARERWSTVRERLRVRRYDRNVWLRERPGMTRARAGELARQGLRPEPDFDTVQERGAARMLPLDVQPRCRVCGSSAADCRCRAADTCGHFVRSRRKDGACPVCRATKASRHLLTTPHKLETGGHFVGIPLTKGEGKDSVSFWGRAPGARGKLPLIPRYVGCEIEVEDFRRRAGFWQRIPRLAALVERWHFSIGTDGSLGSDGREARLSPARGKAAEAQIREVVSALADCGAKITSNCGLHIHVDAADFRSTSQFDSLMESWDVVEPRLFDRMPDRANNTYCKRTEGKRVYVSDRELFFDRDRSERKSTDPVTDRYHALNLANMELLNGGRRTIEFRIFEGSLDPDEIIRWAHIVSTLVHYASRCDKRLASPQGIASLLRPDAAAYLGLER